MKPGTAGAYLAARHAAGTNDYRAAAEFYAQAMRGDSRNFALTENALSARLALGELREAEELAARMIGNGSNSQIAHMAAVAGQTLDQDFEGLVESFRSATRIGPLVDGLLLGWALIGTGQIEEGIAAFDAIALRDGLRPFALHHKALALAYDGRLEEAEEIFAGKGGVEMPDNRRGLIARAQILSALERNTEARAQIARVLGSELDVRFSRLDRRLAAGEPLEFTEVRGAAHGMAEVFYTVSSALNGEASDSYALLYARIAHALNPGHIDAILLSAEYLERLDRPELATLAYDMVPRGAAEYVTAELGRADALRAANRPDAAVEALNQLAEAHPSIPKIHSKLGDVLRRSGRYAEAVTAYDAAIDLYGAPANEHWFTYFARGISFEREDNWPAAEADFRMALELRPNQPQVMNYLGYSLVEKNLKLDEALELIEAAAQLRPDNGHILDSLGWVLYRLGRFDEAVGPMETAVELMATDPIINDHLGDVYWAVGRFKEAHFQWTRALSFDPEPEDVARIRRKLDVGLDVVLEEEGMEPITVANDG
ncbi:MAG: tetratricopeptide repeat protein [Pseudomonadota bacterium]